MLTATGNDKNWNHMATLLQGKWPVVQYLPDKSLLENLFQQRLISIDAPHASGYLSYTYVHLGTSQPDDLDMHI